MGRKLVLSYTLKHKKIYRNVHGFWELKCSVCAKKFEAKRYNALTCSSACRQYKARLLRRVKASTYN